MSRPSYQPPTQVSSRRLATTPQAHAEHVAPRVERYELIERIGRGGMGSVYRAKDRATGEICALKCVQVGERPHAKALLEAFEREYQILRGLRHPRIIQVFDYGVLEQGAFYTMELLTGSDLRRSGPVSWRETCQYMRDIATCLSLLHARRLIHRDLSPGNVKLTGDGHCKVIDFGALTEFGQTDTVIGTPPFIAPEVLTVGRLDQRVDLYALGALAYFCLTGQHAYPAEHIDDLPDAWQVPPPEPSRLNAEVSADLDDLVMSLLRENPLARPASAAEVIARLDVIAQLPAEADAAQRMLVQSFFAAPRYVGHSEELAALSAGIKAATAATGRAVRVIGPSGAGRTRLLEEVAIRAQLAGAAVVRADASAQRGRYGTARTLALSLLTAMPQAARERAQAYKTALAALKGDLDTGVAPFLMPKIPEAPSERISTRPTLGDAESLRWSKTTGKIPKPKVPEAPPAKDQSVENWFVDVSRERPLVVLVDNVECADDASLAMLIGLARAARDQRILLVVAEQTDSPDPPAFGFGTLRAACDPVRLNNLSRAETAELMRSLFGEASRVERLADWMHGQTDGSPLHCLGMLQHFVAQGVIRHERGAWVLPSNRPDTRVAEALGDALRRRLDSLSPDARELAQCLSLQRLDPTLELCRRLVEPGAGVRALALLDELSASDVLHRDKGLCFFSSAALRQVLLSRMGAPARRAAHQRLGQALASMAGEHDLSLLLEAGWHLIRGGEEMRGADMIAAVTRDSVSCNILVANLHHIGAPVEAALEVYRATRRSRRERMPLLSALAQAGYYEHYRWSDAYGDDALDVAEELSGLGLARRLRPFLGAYLSLAFAFLFAVVRHYLQPRRIRGGSFIDLLVQVCSTVTALSGVAAISLNADRCDRVADVLSPAAVLPRRLALVGIYRFCQGLQQIAREHQAEAFATFDELAANFSDKSYYLMLPPEAHIVYITGCHFARGAFAMMRSEGAAALESAAVLERSGLPLYVMIGSQLRYLYHLNRGELGMAHVHRERVELHAARVGSAWQVELWEPASLLPFYMVTGDVVELSRIAYRLAELSESVPSMWRYREIAHMAADLHKHAPELHARLWAEIATVPKRSFIGWSTVHAVDAQNNNERGNYERARALCDRALSEMTDVDREYVMIFLGVDIQAAIADAGLGHTDEALHRLDKEIARHGATTHALALGLLHEARARVAFDAGRPNLYEESLREATRWLRPTGTPALVALCDRLARLGEVGAHPVHPGTAADATTLETVTGGRSRALRSATLT